MSKSRTALITGINGQDGSYLAELLLSHGYEVVGAMRKADGPAGQRMANILPLLPRIRLFEVEGNAGDFLYQAILEIKPAEVYHLASPSFVSYDFGADGGELARQSEILCKILASIRENAPECHFYFAGSSEMFGDATVEPQDERTSFNPRSLYGISKLTCYHICRNFRAKYGLFVSTGILYNHESVRRGSAFVTRKITKSAARIKLGLDRSIALGNLFAVRDWGYAPEYVEAMRCMLNQTEPDDFVIATGTLHSVRDFAEKAFSKLDLNLQDYLETGNEHFRPSEVVPLRGDASKAARILDWTPQKTLDAIIEEMVENDLRIAKVMP